MSDSEKSDYAGDRIAKVLARAGVASRRGAERLIAEGKVAVNGKVIDSPALNVTDADDITIEGKPLPKKEPVRLWRYHKPAGLITSHKDPEGRETVFDKLPKDLPRVISVGRLDLNSEGLLLLTNDGELARQLELPETGWSRRYKVRAFGQTDQAELDKLKNGVELDGIKTGPIEAIFDKKQGQNVWLTVTLHEGKNREVRRALETIDLKVNRLIRLSYGPFQLGSLPKGEVEEVKDRILRDQVGHLVKMEPRKGPSASARAKPKFKKKGPASRRGNPNSQKPHLKNKKNKNADRRR